MEVLTVRPQSTCRREVTEAPSSCAAHSDLQPLRNPCTQPLSWFSGQGLQSSWGLNISVGPSPVCSAAEYRTLNQEVADSFLSQGTCLGAGLAQ